MQGLLTLTGGDRPDRTVLWDGVPPERCLLPVELPVTVRTPKGMPSDLFWRVAYRLERIDRGAEGWLALYRYEGVAY